MPTNVAVNNVPFDIIIPNPPATAANLVAPKPTIAQLPVGWNLQDLILNIPAALIPAMLVQIVLKANGNPVQTWYGYSDLDKANQEMGLPAASLIAGNQFLRVPLIRYAQQGGRDRFTPASGTGSSAVAAAFVSGAIRNLECLAGFNTGIDPASQAKGIAGITNPTLELWFTNTPATAEQVTVQALGYPMRNGGPGTSITVAGTQIPLVTGVNTLSAQNGLKYGSDFLRETDRLILVPSAGTLDNFVVYQGQTQYKNRSLALDQFLKGSSFGFRKDQSGAGMYVLDFTERAFGDESLVTNDPKSNIQIQFTSTNPGTLTLYQQGFGNPLVAMNS